MYPLTVPSGNKIAMLTLCALFINVFTQAQCTASGPNSPGASASTSFPGSDYSFSNPSNILTNDNNRSTASSILSLLSGQTDYLQATNFGFSIPTAAAICGIEVHVEKSATNLLLNLTSVTDHSVRIIKNGSITGTNMAQNTIWSEDLDAISTYGNTNALWAPPGHPQILTAPTLAWPFLQKYLA
ncbi:hypothetical protein [Longitalea arenae]|uniref:hypothetical protein n=1 Tax=Longitalea arenae TaxID=2812558 RepID=UPI001967E0AC|nr:hypothetical protein [Longitalea arenae]